VKKQLGSFAVALWVLASTTLLTATPSTEFWTAGTSDIQPYGIGHLGIDNYYHFANYSGESMSGDLLATLPTDLGYTVGILPFSKVQMELGVDFMGAATNPLMFNAKIGIPEDAFFKGQPGVAAGMFGIGLKKNYNDQDVGYAVIGKTLPIIGRLFVGGYMGNKVSLLGSDDKGFTVAWDRSFLPTKSASGADFNRITVCADYASGKNYYGAGGGGIAYYFTENISILTGPVFFNEPTLNGKWKWSTQLDVNFKTW
jgi:hypothetical protein